MKLTSNENDIVNTKGIEALTLTTRWEYMLDNQWLFYPYCLEESFTA